MINEYQVQKPQRSMKKILLLITLLAILIAVGFLIYAFAKINRPVSSGSGEVSFSVPKGASTKDVGERLESENLISSANIFVAYAMFSGSSGKIQAGDYVLMRNMDLKEILEVLSSGKVTKNSKKATIVEGRTNKQIAERLDELGIVTGASFLNALNADYDFEYASVAKSFDYEGFLFPDTYEFSVNWSAEDIVNRMLENFESKITAQMLEDMQRKSLTMKEVIALASIIEKEVGRAPTVTLTADVRAKMQEERKNVASIFYNRLEIDMPLQSDATVNYVTGKADRRALIEDTKVNSPYNTYQVTGLPPGPISNPGIDSIMAAIYPNDTDYFYFLNNKEGIAFYGRTLEEHNSNRVRYLD